MPDRTHGTVIQLAQSDLTYPPPVELLATPDRDHASYPSTQGATDPLWWEPVWDVEPESAARLGATYLGSKDLELSARPFRDALGARAVEADGALRFTWPSGTVLVHHIDRPGITGLALHNGPSASIRIGGAAGSARASGLWATDG